MSLKSTSPEKERPPARFSSTASTSPTTMGPASPQPPVTEWVEIIEPRTKEHMYANLTTGECVWDPPPGVHVKKTSENQWWELFDQNTSRFYYYNATSQQTVWHRPANCDIIPLAKLQTLKQNTQVRGFQDAGDEVASTTSSMSSTSGLRKSSVRHHRSDTLSQTQISSPLTNFPASPAPNAFGGSDRRASLKMSTSSQSQTSPMDSPKSSSRRRHHHSHHHHHHRHHNRQLSQPSIAAPPPRQFAPTIEDDQEVVLRPKVSRRSVEDEAAGRYYSVPHRVAANREAVDAATGSSNYASPMSRQRSLEGEQFRAALQQQQQQQQHHYASGYHQHPQHQPQHMESTTPTSSISRSVSFIGGRPQPPPPQPQRSSHMESTSTGSGSTRNNFGGSSWRASFDSGGRRSVESTPQSSRRTQPPQSTVYSTSSLKKSPPEKGFSRARGVSAAHEGAGSNNLDGYCTPMINRKLSIERADMSAISQVKAKPQPKPRTLVNNHNSSPPMSSNLIPQEQSPNLSISQLVDSGMSALHDDNGNGDDYDMRMVGNNNHHGENSGSRKQPRRGSKMSPLQMYILEQAKLSGYRLRGGDTLNGDRDSYVESEDDRGRESDDFADDEDDELSLAESSINGEEDYDEEDGDDAEDRYLSEPTYNNLDPNWLQSFSKGAPPVPPVPPHQHHPPPQVAPRTQFYPPHATKNFFQSNHDVDAFSEEFDLRMRFGASQSSRLPPHAGQATASSTMPRPSSHSGGGVHSLPGASHPLSSAAASHYNTASPTTSGFQQNPAFPVPYEVLHPSLQRNAHSLVVDHATSAALAAATAAAQSGGMGSKVPASMSSAHLHHLGGGIDGIRPTFQRGSSLSVSASLQSGGGAESDIEKYAQDNLNVQKKGLFRKKMTVKDILSWTEEPIRKPLTCLTDKTLKKDAVESFRLMQIYMGDRKARQGMTVNSVALDIATLGYTKAAIRDEVYVQLCKQTTDNPKKESLRRGWELMAICLSFFPPSSTFSSCLFGYICKHRDPALDDYHDVNKWPIHVQISHYAAICSRRLERIGDGGRLAPRKPTVDDVDQSRLQIFRPSMFGGTLGETMEIQRDRFPHRRLPWILTALADQVIQLNGLSTEGIFRVPADLDEVNNVKCRFDQWEVVTCTDCHTAASLLKLWLRELYEPLVPDDFYEESVDLATRLEAASSKDSSSADADVFRQQLLSMVQRLPDLNRLVLIYLIHFLQLFARTEASSITKMDAANLATVFAPNCLRCPSSDPSVILENTRKEMAFVKHLILSLETSAIEGVL